MNLEAGSKDYAIRENKEPESKIGGSRGEKVAFLGDITKGGKFVRTHTVTGGGGGGGGGGRGGGGGGGGGRVP